MVLESDNQNRYYEKAKFHLQAMSLGTSEKIRDSIVVGQSLQERSLENNV
jgi:hypothetical protein